MLEAASVGASMRAAGLDRALAADLQRVERERDHEPDDPERHADSRDERTALALGKPRRAARAPR